MKLRRKKVRAKPTPKKRTPKRVSRESTPKPRKSVTPIRYPKLDLSKYRPQGDTKKAKAAQAVFDNWPKELSSYGISGRTDLRKYIEDTLEKFGFKLNPGSWSFLEWGPLRYEQNKVGFNRDHPWPHPKELWAQERKICAWKSKREWGYLCWKEGVVTPAQYDTIVEENLKARAELQKKWKKDIARERAQGRKSAGFKFPKKKK